MGQPADSGGNGRGGGLFQRLQLSAKVAGVCMSVSCILVALAVAGQYVALEVWWGHTNVGDRNYYMFSIGLPLVFYACTPLWMLIVTLLARGPFSKMFVLGWLILVGLAFLGFLEFRHVLLSQ